MSVFEDFIKRVFTLNKEGNQTVRIADRLIRDLEKDFKENKMGAESAHGVLKNLKRLEAKMGLLVAEQKMLNMRLECNPTSVRVKSPT